MKEANTEKPKPAPEPKYTLFEYAGITGMDEFNFKVAERLSKDGRRQTKASWSKELQSKITLR